MQDVGGRIPADTPEVPGRFGPARIPTAAATPAACVALLAHLRHGCSSCTSQVACKTSCTTPKSDFDQKSYVKLCQNCCLAARL